MRRCVEIRGRAILPKIAFLKWVRDNKVSLFNGYSYRQHGLPLAEDLLKKVQETIDRHTENPYSDNLAQWFYVVLIPEEDAIFLKLHLDTEVSICEFAD